MGRVLTIIILIVALILVAAWLGNGGWAQIKAIAPQYSNPLGDFWEEQKKSPVVPSIESLAPATPTISGESISSPSSIPNQKDFGDPSPSRGQIVFEPVRIYYTGDSSVASEYVTLRAAGSNTAPIDITGWSLASAVSGVRKFIPQGATLYQLGNISAISNVYLSPGASATINSGTSPVGVSFRTNLCTGYLEQFQDFSPSLGSSCPSPYSELPLTADNLRTYGAECIDFVRNLPSCEYYLGEFPETISNTCRSFVGNALTYNGCVNRHQFDANFAGTAWRIYLGSSYELWNNTHDVLRLLDASGRTVDVWTY